MRSPAPVFTTVSSTLALVALVSCGCASSTSARAVPSPSRAPLPAWHGALAQEFDDAIEAEALEADQVRDHDAWVGPRTQAADHVLRVVVVSTTTQGVGHHQGYRLTLRVIGAPLSGSAPPSNTIELSIPPDSPVFPLARMHDIRLTGKTFLGFFKTFGAGDTQDLHWHLNAETAETLQAVARASTLAEVGFQQAAPAR